MSLNGQSGSPSKPKVWHINDPNCPPGAILIDRRTPLGNPFKIGAIHPVSGRPMTRDDAVDVHMDWLKGAIVVKALTQVRLTVLTLIPRLRGRHLKGWCAPLRCHGDNYLELANE